MARMFFSFLRSHLICFSLLALQLLVSGTHAVRCSHDFDDDFECDDSDDDPATRKRDRIIGASVAGATLVIIAIAFFIYEYRKRRLRARLPKQLPPYPFAVAPVGFPAQPGPPPPGYQGYPQGYSYGYSQPMAAVTKAEQDV